MYCETCVLDTECGACAAGVPCRAVPCVVFRMRSPRPVALSCPCLFLISCVCGVGRSFWVFMPRHVSCAIDAGFAAKPLRGALRIILREVMQVAAVHSKGALTH